MNRSFDVPATSYVDESISPRFLPEGISTPAFSRVKGKNIDQYWVTLDDMWDTFKHFNIHKILFKKETQNKLKFKAEQDNVTLCEVRPLSSFAANFYIYEFFGYGNGVTVSEQDVEILVENIDFVKAIVNSEVDLSNQQMATIAAVGQRMLVDYLEETIFHYIIMASLGEIRYHPFAHQAFFGGQLKSLNQSDYEQPRRVRHEKFDNCYCEACDYVWEESRYEARNPQTDRTEAWILGIDWVLENPAELFDLMAELFMEFSHNEGYGGSSWAKAPEVLAMRQRGKLGPTEFQNRKLFLDRAFSLEHNGGYLFDKLYDVEDLHHTLDAHHSDNLKTLFSFGAGDITKRLYEQAKRKGLVDK